MDFVTMGLAAALSPLLIGTIGLQVQGSIEDLTTVKYGSGSGQLGVRANANPDPIGPGAFRVGPDGSVTICDTVNHCVKRFNSRGILLFATSDRLDGMSALAVTESGSFWVLHDHNGTTLSHYDASGRLLRQIDADNSIANDVFGQIGLGSDLYSGLADGVWVSSRIGAGESKCFSFDKDGAFLRSVAGGVVSRDGETVIIASLNAAGDRRSMEIAKHDTNGAATASMRLKPLDIGWTLENLSDPDAGLSPLQMVDSQGRCYTVWGQRVPSPTRLGLGLTVRVECVVTQYAADGQARGRLVLPDHPFPTPPPFDISPDGSFFFLSYGPDAVTVMRYRFPESASATAVRAFPMIKVAGVRRIPLEALAQTQGYAVKWDSKSKTVVLHSFQRASITLRTSSGDLVNHEGGIWVSESAARRLCTNLKVSKNRQMGLAPYSVARR